MTTKFVITVAAALAVGTAVAGAQERRGPPAPGANLLPAHEIITILRSTGFDPVGRPVRMGSRYEVQAIDPDDDDVRLLVDGRTGRILTVRDGDGMEPMAPPFPREDFRQASGRFGPLSYGPMRPGGLVPPRGIPTGRSSATVDPPKAPVPRPRPEARGEPAMASTTPSAPTGTRAAPGATTTTSPPTAPAAGSSPSADTVPSASVGVKDSVGAIAGKTDNPASNGSRTPTASGPPAPDTNSAVTATESKMVPIAPLE